MRVLVPPFIYKQALQGSGQGSLEAIVLFADISG